MPDANGLGIYPAQSVECWAEATSELYRMLAICAMPCVASYGPEGSIWLGNERAGEGSPNRRKVLGFVEMSGEDRVLIAGPRRAVLIAYAGARYTESEAWMDEMVNANDRC